MTSKNEDSSNLAERQPTARIKAKESSITSVSRRNVLIGTFAGMFTASNLAATGVKADGEEGDIDISFQDAYGGNRSGEPETFSIGDGEETEITVEWDDLVDGQQVYVKLSVRPESGDFEELGETAFIVNESSGSEVITPSDFTEEERDLTTHSEISTSDFFIENDLDELEDKSNRTITRSYWIEVLVETDNGDKLAEEEGNFSATFGLTSGFGDNFGYNFGKVYPTEDFETAMEE